MGSCKSDQHDQILTSVLTGPIVVGMHRFVLKADPPDFDAIPFEEITLTGTRLVASFNDQEFFRIGYYVQNNLPEDWEQTRDVSQIERVFIDEDTTIRQNQIQWK